MTKDKRSVQGALEQLLAAFEPGKRRPGLKVIRTHLNNLRSRLMDDERLELAEEAADLRQKLRHSKTSFDAMVASYKALLDTFDTFRNTIDIVHQMKRLDELPQALAAIRQLRALPTLHLVLDQDTFSGRVPVGIDLAPSQTLRSRVTQFSPVIHAPRLYLGDVTAIDNAAFFLGTKEDPDTGSCFIFALKHKYLQRKTIGVLAAYDPDPTRFTPDKATDFLGHFCDILACTLVTLLEHAQLEELSVRDALTGVNNRTYLERHAGRILDFSVRKNLPVYLLFIDLNGFKKINDTLGHEVGDLILVAVAKTIQTMIRKYDIFVRLGGDEFVIILPDTDESRARTFVDRLGHALSLINVADISGVATSLTVSASVGMARHQAHQTLDELIRAADQGMYAQKHLCRTSANEHLNATPNTFTNDRPS